MTNCCKKSGCADYDILGWSCVQPMADTGDAQFHKLYNCHVNVDIVNQCTGNCTDTAENKKH